MIAYQPTSWSLEVVCYATKTKYPAWLYYYARSTYGGMGNECYGGWWLGRMP